MNRKTSILTFLLLFFFMCGISHATLIMNISDDGSGNSRFEFSGSAIVTGATNYTAVNGIWISHDAFSSPFMSSGAVQRHLTVNSGSGTMSSSTGGIPLDSNNLGPGGTWGVLSVWSSGTFGFSPIMFPSYIRFSNQAILSWEGNLVTSTPFSDFLSGEYRTRTLKIGNVGSATIDSDYILTIEGSGSPAPVPEPATMFLFGLGLLGLAGVSRKKK